MSAKTRKLMLGLLLGLLTAVMLAGCGGGGDNQVIDPNGIRPSITALSRNAANIGEQLSVIGLNFGDTQSGGNVRLNGVDFGITNWTDTVIDVTVSAGMVSGIVVVTVGGLESQSGQQAQLFIPAAPAGRPVITAVSPEYGRPADAFQVAGQGFGAAQGAGNVVFVNGAGDETVAPIETVIVGETQVVQWGNNSIKALVPNGLTAGTYTVYVTTGTEQSNVRQFTVLPRVYPEDAPVITGVTPGNGAAGTGITLTGDFFGHTQGDSTLLINGMALDIVAWSYTVINALIPVGAETGKIEITVGGRTYSWPPDEGEAFVVANTPLITGVTPSQVRIGHELTLYGKYFGLTQGTGSVMVGGMVQPVASWLPTVDPEIQEIRIDALKPFKVAGETQYDDNGDPIVDIWGNPVPFYQVQVTADNGLASAVEYVSLVTNLKAVVTVDPQAGQRSGAGAGETGTSFMFHVAVTGGSGNYSYQLVPDKSVPSVMTAAQSSADIEYIYPALASAAQEQTYETMVSVVDQANQDSLMVAGPAVLVVQYGTPVITRLGVQDFNRTGALGPNDWCYLAGDGTYNDFTFRNDAPLFTTSRCDILSGGNPLPHYVRNLGSYLIDGETPRGQGYRYYNDDAVATNDGAVITVRGLNFGNTLGEVWLRSAGGDRAVTDFAGWTEVPGGWSDTEIRFYVPAGSYNLSGLVQVVPSGGTLAANSFEPLVCSPYVLAVAPAAGVDLATGTVTLTGFDFQPPTIGGKVGELEYGIWMVRASYTDPWDSQAKTGLVLLTTPVAPSSLAGTAMQFTLADLDIDGDGVVPVEVTSPSGDEAAVVDGTLEEGTYYFFLWTGALADGTPNEIAKSGIFSEAYEVGVVKGGGGNQAPTAVLQCNPNNGTAPLACTINGTTSFDIDGTITDYEWDFDGDGNYNEAGEEAAAQGNAGPHNYTYDADGDYLVKLRVTDDGTPALTNVATQNVHVGGGGPGNQLTLRVKININGFATGGTTQTRCWVFRKDTAPNPPPGGGDIPICVHQMDVDDGNFVTHVFTQQDDGNPLIDGTYWIQLTRVVTTWDGADDTTTMLGPFTLPPDPVVSSTGDQYAEIPGPHG